MIGVKSKKKKNDTGQADFDLVEGQAAIFGKVTERNIYTNSVTDAEHVIVTIYQNNNFIAFTSTSSEGEYFIEAINMGADYTVEFVKDSVYTTPVFSLASQEVKEINVQLTTDNFS